MLYWVETGKDMVKDNRGRVEAEIETVQTPLLKQV
jgi:hypothetical protein